MINVMADWLLETGLYLLGVALIPKKRTRRVFPQASLTTTWAGTLALHLGIRGEF